MMACMAARIRWNWLCDRTMRCRLSLAAFGYNMMAFAQAGSIAHTKHGLPLMHTT